MSRFITFLCAAALIFCASSSLAQPATEEKKETAPVQKKDTASEQMLIEVGGVLLPRGTLTIEPSIQYSHFSRRSISISGFTILQAIVIGTIAVSDIKRDFLQGALTTRYGITSWLEAELKVPYVYTSFRDVKGPGTTDITERRIQSTALGDIEGAIYGHVIKEKGIIPDVVLNFRAKSPTGNDPYHLKTDAQGNLRELPTGSGHWGFSGGFTLVKRSDPVVFFGGLNYFWNVRKKVRENIGTVDPGDSWEGSIGLAYALSEKFSLSGIYLHRITMKQKLDGRDVKGTFVNYGTLGLAGSYALSKNTYVNLSVNIGVTNDAPDVEVRLAIPFNFKIF